MQRKIRTKAATAMSHLLVSHSVPKAMSRNSIELFNAIEEKQNNSVSIIKQNASLEVVPSRTNNLLLALVGSREMISNLIKKKDFQKEIYKKS